MSQTPDAQAGPAAGADSPLAGATNRATTTERRTTTTTTTKRTVKSSDDFLPASSELQQVRSESRTGSVSSQAPLLAGRAAKQAAGWPQAGAEAAGQSPQLQDTEEGRLLKLRFDVAQYAPDEILVKTLDNRLTVHAQHEEKSEHRSVYREYNREFHLPDGTDVELIRSSLSRDGVLTVECPLPSPQLQGAARRIPIERE